MCQLRFNMLVKDLGALLASFYFIYCFVPLIVITPAEKIRYISTEHPCILYLNPKYIKYANLTSQRYGRTNPFYYVGFHYESVVPFSKDLTIHFYFLEYLSNVYKRSFVEMHYKFCDLVKKDNFFGAPMHQGKLLGPCPYPPGQYNLYNMSIDIRVIPPGFPFTKGRIFTNMTGTYTKELWGNAYIDMEVKEINIRRRGRKGNKTVTPQ